MLYLVAQSLGLWHVTQRYDRDQYVTVNTDNLLPSYQGDLSALQPSSRLLDTFGLHYDFASLMHFPAKVGPLIHLITGVKRELLDTAKARKLLWSHNEETRELPGEGDNARNNARCTKARKATHGLDGQHQDVDRTLRGRVNQNERGQG